MTVEQNIDGIREIHAATADAWNARLAELKQCVALMEAEYLAWWAERARSLAMAKRGRKARKLLGTRYATVGFIDRFLPWRDQVPDLGYEAYGFAYFAIFVDLRWRTVLDAAADKIRALSSRPRPCAEEDLPGLADPYVTGA